VWLTNLIGFNEAKEAIKKSKRNEMRAIVTPILGNETGVSLPVLKV